MISPATLRCCRFRELYVMTPEEAVQAALAIHPKIAVPMHYAAIVGTDADAIKFKGLVKNCQVEIL